MVRIVAHAATNAVAVSGDYQPFLEAIVQAMNHRDGAALKSLSAVSSPMHGPTILRYLQYLPATTQQSATVSAELIPWKSTLEGNAHWVPQPIKALVLTWETATGGGGITHPVGLVDGLPKLCDIDQGAEEVGPRPIVVDWLESNAATSSVPNKPTEAPAPEVAEPHR